jgi:hypothetical protein
LASPTQANAENPAKAINLRSWSSLQSMEHRAGIEPANTGFADQRVSHFTTGALG